MALPQKDDLPASQRLAHRKTYLYIQGIGVIGNVNQTDKEAGGQGECWEKTSEEKEGKRSTEAYISFHEGWENSRAEEPDSLKKNIKLRPLRGTVEFNAEGKNRFIYHAQKFVLHTFAPAGGKNKKKNKGGERHIRKDRCERRNVNI